MFPCMLKLHILCDKTKHTTVTASSSIKLVRAKSENRLNCSVYSVSLSYLSNLKSEARSMPQNKSNIYPQGLRVMDSSWVFNDQRENKNMCGWRDTQNRDCKYRQRAVKTEAGRQRALWDRTERAMGDDLVYWQGLLFLWSDNIA